MLSLDETRLKIDEIDKKMMDLFVQRMELVSDVVLYKKQNNMEIFQSDREQIVIEKNVNTVDDELKIYAKEFMEDVMNISKDYQMSKL